MAGEMLFIVVILLLIRVLHRMVVARIHDTDDRRRLRKSVSLVGYIWQCALGVRRHQGRPRSEDPRRR